MEEGWLWAQDEIETILGERGFKSNTVDSANTGLSEYRNSPDSGRSGQSRIFSFYFFVKKC
ncbi:hypothetical protein DPMN_148500 [Dreissena polymorpha]|uniref:Uncharacterized protein n=1 Tax=Dreissena polymorpha TaxID=45954 RepID=A0A9D4J421_DREPO|nr:hypothetical protein DPMN_148482 [Dreissena polymorpha]KAH3794958.1 hypothetical protein DPMN_148500 [Dreissena polymorpha]